MEAFSIREKNKLVVDRRYTPAEAAKIIGHTRRYIVQHIRAGTLPANDERSPKAKIPRFFIKESDLIRWMEGMRYDPEADKPSVSQGPTIPAPASTLNLMARMRLREKKKKVSRDRGRRNQVK